MSVKKRASLFSILFLTLCSIAYANIPNLPNCCDVDIGKVDGYTKPKQTSAAFIMDKFVISTKKEIPNE